ncbi:hypothetical protein [Baaleninema simplex]|uniref:hypothetical protein n=1 Tax=Baaleninema simplex TaxID=2862350 RepID=UPI00034CF713|nr:hypothetical protein [Baaleninema simplex]
MSAKHARDRMSVDDLNIQWFRRRLTAWGRENLRQFPWRDTHDPYRILIAESLLQKTTVEAVLPTYNSFLTMGAGIPRFYRR